MKMAERVFNRHTGLKFWPAILCLTVWIAVFGIVFPEPVLSGCGAMSTSAQKGDVISVKPVNGTMVDDVIVTDVRELILYVEFEGGNPSFFQICDNEMFELCEWQRMRFDGKIVYTLSEGAGMKKVYLRAKFLNKPGRTMVMVVNYTPK